MTEHRQASHRRDDDRTRRTIRATDVLTWTRVLWYLVQLLEHVLG